MKAEIQLNQDEVEEAVRLYVIQRLAAQNGAPVIFKAPIKVTFHVGRPDSRLPLVAVVQLETE